MSERYQAASDFTHNVKSLNELIVKGDTIKAMEALYTDELTMRENEDDPRVRKELCIGYERQTLKRFVSKTDNLLSQAIDTENKIVFGEWEYLFTTGDNKIVRLKEVSIQCWNGVQVTREKFYCKEFL